MDINILGFLDIKPIMKNSRLLDRDSIQSSSRIEIHLGFQVDRDRD